MGKLGCPCGSVISDSSDDHVYALSFVPEDVLQEHWNSTALFGKALYGPCCYDDDISCCGECGTLAFFDSPINRATRHMALVDAQETPKASSALPYRAGRCWTSNFFDELDDECDRLVISDSHYRFLSAKYDDGYVPLTPRIAFDELLPASKPDEGRRLGYPPYMRKHFYGNGRMNAFPPPTKGQISWWYAKLYEEWFVLYHRDDPKMTRPYLVWRRCDLEDTVEEEEAMAFDAAVDKMLIYLAQQGSSAPLSLLQTLCRLEELGESISIENGQIGLNFIRLDRIQAAEKLVRALQRRAKVFSLEVTAKREPAPKQEPLASTYVIVRSQTS